MARSVEISVNTAAGLVSVLDKSTTSPVPAYYKFGGLGEYTINSAGLDLGVSTTQIELWHQSGQHVGLFAVDELTSVQIDLTPVTYTTLDEALAALIPYLFSQGAGGFTHSLKVELTPTQLTTEFSIAGIELLPAAGSGKYYDWEMDFVNRGDGTEVYAGGNVFEIKSGPQVLARVSETLLTTVGPTQVVAMGVRPSQLQGANARYQATEPNQPLVLKTISDTDYTLADVADGSTVYVLIRYNIITVA